MFTDPSEVLAFIEDTDVKFLDLRFTDLPGVQQHFNIPAATVDELASGKSAYETNCVLCHRLDGTGGRVSIEGKNLNVENLTAAKFRMGGE